MKVNSKWAATPIVICYLLSFALIIVDTVMWIGLKQGISLINFPIHFQLSIVALGLFFLVRSFGASVLKYSDDGAVMEFYIEHPLIKYTNGDLVKRYDFPKEKLVSYRSKKQGFKRFLVLKLTRGEKAYKRVNIPITFLRKEEKQILLDSLDSILEKNKNGQ